MHAYSQGLRDRILGALDRGDSSQQQSSGDTKRVACECECIRHAINGKKGSAALSETIDTDLMVNVDECQMEQFDYDLIVRKRSKDFADFAQAHVH